MKQDPSFQFYASYNAYPRQWNALINWKPTQNQPWKQSRGESTYGNMAPQQF